ncbi:MAG: OstA-like protein [Flavobacterium sp.]|nr:OstA-like protein [Flavobacterium sp.]
MKKLSFFVSFCLILIYNNNFFAQAPKKIVIEYSDFGDRNEALMPGAALLTGNVRVSQDGMILTCNKAYYYENENYVKAFGNVQMVQGDTLFLNSKYAEYNGNVRQALATGDVVMRSPESTLNTEIINFDRNSQEAYYNQKGTIINRENTLVSDKGRYFVNKKMFQFRSAVTITNPKYLIKTNHLDYYTNSGHSYLFGPSTIISKENYIYTEKGFYNTKKNTGHFLDKSYIKYNDRIIRGDSLYYDRSKEFASATNHVKITDSINKGVVRGHYAEMFKQKDSLFITKHAVAATLVEKDSVYIHAKKLLITGKEGERILRGYKNARFYKKDLTGKCDSIYSDSKKALTKLINKPVLWNFDNQMTGDIMHLVGNNTTQKLDSLKVLNNAFLVSKDTLGTGYNQVKGQNLYGKFRDSKLYECDIIKNTEVIYFMRNDDKELIGINKNVSSKINLTLEGNTVDTMTFFTNVDGTIYPEKDLPENARKLKGFVWRGDERIKNMEDIFPQDEKDLDDKINKKRIAEQCTDAEKVEMPIRKETLNYDKKKK